LVDDNVIHMTNDASAITPSAFATPSSYVTPYEAGNQNQTTSWAECIAFYQKLALDFPAVLQFFQIGVSDNGIPMHAGVVSADGVFNREALQSLRRPIFFNNNGIHPGEPEGIDACMALVRDLCTDPKRLAALGATVYLFIPVYNVDGCLNRNSSSRVNQNGPESFGFRGNGRNLDLNRDFIKCDSLAARTFNRFFTAWDPDVMVDTHTSNGADYSYTMTLIHTQTDKLGGALGGFLRDSMLPVINAEMSERGWPIAPYVHLVGETPESGIEHTLESPRFSTGYAALHHTLGFMPETHMLKPFAQRYASTRALLDVVLAFTVSNAVRIKNLRLDAKKAFAASAEIPVHWQIDFSRPESIAFSGFAALHSPSKLGNYIRLSYDRSQPWTKEISFFSRCNADVVVKAPVAYLIPQAWREVIERLQWNGVLMQRLEAAQSMAVRSLRIDSVSTRAAAYEGHMFHDEMRLSEQFETYQAQAGDFLVVLDQPNARYAVETLEPQGHDSFFRWGFFNSVLEKKEHYSDYIFEETALEMLAHEPELNAAFEQWKRSNPLLLSDQEAVLDFIFTHGKRHVEPSWQRYPVLSLMA
jgi:hypothetical protein